RRCRHDERALRAPPGRLPGPRRPTIATAADCGLVGWRIPALRARRTPSSRLALGRPRSGRARRDRTRGHPPISAGGSQEVWTGTAGETRATSGFAHALFAASAVATTLAGLLRDREWRSSACGCRRFHGRGAASTRHCCLAVSLRSLSLGHNAPLHGCSVPHLGKLPQAARVEERDEPARELRRDPFDNPLS